MDIHPIKDFQKLYDKLDPTKMNSIFGGGVLKKELKYIDDADLSPSGAAYNLLDYTITMGGIGFIYGIPTGLFLGLVDQVLSRMWKTNIRRGSILKSYFNSSLTSMYKASQAGAITMMVGTVGYFMIADIRNEYDLFNFIPSGAGIGAITMYLLQKTVIEAKSTIKVKKMPFVTPLACVGALIGGSLTYGLYLFTRKREIEYNIKNLSELFTVKFW
eukprot:TRINITY_DN184_c2_g1_i1.p1 TRINITY_DN184_c2_g1~~TRINITY_DN184_c2_g1_i1.p1  ORF type:complete len:216 (-),score=66.74 TRINITY_DN184_c2_g1_i1:9-656(-)